MRQSENFRLRIGMAGPPRPPSLPPTHVGGPTVPSAPVYPRSQRQKHQIKTSILNTLHLLSKICNIGWFTNKQEPAKLIGGTLKPLAAK